MLSATPSAPDATQSQAVIDALEAAAKLCELWNTSTGSQLAKEIRKTLITHPQNSSQWKDISTANLTDDLIWLFDGVDSIEGPRTLEHDDYDKFPYWAECTWPSTSALITDKKEG